MTEPKNVLVVAAHPDDEILGCGGTLARHCAAGDRVEILIIAEGATARAEAHEKTKQRGNLAALHEAAKRAASIIGAALPTFASLPDNRLDQVDLLDIVKLVEAKLSTSAPHIVYTHHGGDLNLDHRIVHQAVITACRPLPDTTFDAIYSFETLSSTEWSDYSLPAFKANRFVDISATLETKLSALAEYESEMREFPHPRSVKAVTALAELRGATCGTAAAEAFMVIREVVRW